MNAPANIAAIHSTIASLAHANARTAVATYPSLERTAMHLPAAYQVRLMRTLCRELSWSDGVDDIEKGLDWIEADLREETLANDEPSVANAGRA